jgi:hypothetical protein
MKPFYVAVEGITDEAVAKRIIRHLGFQYALVINAGGKSALRKKISSYNEAARHFPWFVITDLDSPSRCPVEYAREWLPNPNSRMVFRVAVPELEAWLLASRQALAKYMQLSLNLIPERPELLTNPKLELINLAAKSRSKSIREDLRRPDGRIGPGYSARIIEFAMRYWDIEEAMQHSESLKRCVKALSRISKI